MKHATLLQSSFATLFDPSVARAAVERAAQWDLPRHLCRPLDHYVGPRVSADLAAYDAAVELATLSEEEMVEDSTDAASSEADILERDFDDSDDL